MRLMPKRQSRKIAWCKVHVAPWAEHAGAIGTSTAAVEAFDTTVQEARAALTAAARARDQARAATLVLKGKIAAMEAAAANIVRQVRAEAEATDNPHVYALACLPAPAKPSPVGAPGRPFKFETELLQDGTVELKWKCRHPHGCTGVMYHLWRRPIEGGEYVYLASTGVKKFRDETLPEGTAGVTYKVQAVRSTRSGGSGECNVHFGRPAGSGARPRIAA